MQTPLTRKPTAFSLGVEQLEDRLQPSNFSMITAPHGANPVYGFGWQQENAVRVWATTATLENRIVIQEKAMVNLETLLTILDKEEVQEVQTGGSENPMLLTTEEEINTLDNDLSKLSNQNNVMMDQLQLMAEQYITAVNEVSSFLDSNASTQQAIARNM